MNYCFSARPALDVFSPKLFLEIKENYDQEAKGVFVVTDSKEANKVKSIIPDAVTCEVAAFIREKWDDLNFERFCEYEKKYECEPLWKYIYTDRFLIYRDYDYVVKMTSGFFMFYERLFKDNNIQVYYSEAIATLQGYVAYLVGRKMGVHYYGQTGAKSLDGTHHYIFDDPYSCHINIAGDYLNNSYSSEEYQKASHFLTQAEEKGFIPTYMITNGVKPRFRLRFLVLPLIRLILSFDKRLNDPCSYMYYESHKTVTDPIKYYWRYRKYKKYFHKADYSKKYVYFPLHFQPEASTIVCAQKYEKQLYFIDSWAKSLPADTLLYVKEHATMLGHRDPLFYKHLKSYPNVVLIDPYESSFELSQKAVAVTTLTGTAGWEAMLLRKPVLIGGNVYYEHAPGVMKISDIYGKYLELLNAWVQPSREDVVKYLCAYFRAVRPGVSFGRANGVSDTDENIKLMAKSLMEAIGKHQYQC